ncbi:hypothetical protein BDW22DRAFT_1431588 [Trametopsis cervina]|nr:hypothetical protein BDW22DRAFT_1431588 [Trametopsis cervina]
MSSETSIPANGLDLVPTLGPLYWGFLCSLILMGINILQGYIYFPSHDGPTIQTIAMSMIVLNVASSALVAQSVFYYLVPHFGSLLPLNAITNELSAECLISTLITLISQAYFVAQLYTVSKASKKHTIIPFIVGILAIGAFVFGVACTTVMVIHKHSVLASRSTLFSVFFGLAKGFGALTDIVATIAMCLMLASARSGLANTNTVLRTLMQYIMQRGILVTLIQTLLLITFHAAPKHLYWLAFHVNVTKLYANTFFAMLNGRDRINQQRGIGGVSGYPSNINFGSRETKSKMSVSHSGSHEREDDIELSMHSPSEFETKSRGPDMPMVTKTVIISEL